jgi:hypothetical protein
MGWAELDGAAAFRKAWPRDHERAIVRPGLGDQLSRRGERGWLDDVLQHVYLAAPVAVLVDELAGIVDENAPGRWLSVIRTRGRGRGITSLVASQRPARIPMVVKTELSHLFVFELLSPDDRDTVADLMGQARRDYRNPSRKHGYLYWSPGMDGPLDCLPMAPPKVPSSDGR